MADPFLTLLSRPRRHETVVLAWDPADAQMLQRARSHLARLERTSPKLGGDDHFVEVEAARRVLTELEEELSTIRFEFESIGTRAADSILDACPPSKEQQSKHKAANSGQSLAYDHDRYPRKLVAATCKLIVTPDGDEITDIDEDRISQLFAVLSISDQVTLFRAAVVVDQDGSSVDVALKG